MTILFGPYLAGDENATGAGELRLLGQALAIALTTGADTTALGVGGLQLVGAVVGTLGFEYTDPEIPVTGIGSVIVAGGGEGSYNQFEFANVSGQLLARGYSYALVTDGDPPAGTTFAFGSGRLTVRGNGVDADATQSFGYALLVEQAAMINGYSGLAFETLDDTLGLGTELTSRLDYVVQSIMRMGDQLTPLARFAVTITDSLVFREFATVVFQRELQDSLVLTDENTGVLRIIGLLTDQLMLADEAISRYDALVTVVSTFLLADRAVIGLDGTIDEALILNDDLSSQVHAIATLMSDLMLADELEGILYLFATVEDTFSLGDETTPLLALLAELMDTMSFGVRVRAGDEVITGYTMNTRLAAVSEYENYPFTSLAMIGGRRYGAGEGGVFRLEGEDDDGDPIAAHIRTGYLNFDMLTRVPNAWIGYTSTGELRLKVHTTDGGVRKENWYRMKARPNTGSPEETRFDIAKGLIGTYWAFEIENLDGADFELDIVKIWPLRTQRRYSGR